MSSSEGEGEATVTTCCVHCAAVLPSPAFVRFAPPPPPTPPPPQPSSASTTQSTSLALLRCRACGELADPHVEWELPLIAMDASLHRVKAWTHLVRNRALPRNQLARFVALVVAVDALTMAWAAERAAPAVQVLTSAVALAVSALAVFVLRSAFLRYWGDHQPPLFRALVLSRLPSVGVFFVATAWDYDPLTTRALLETYAFTSLVAASHAATRRVGDSTLALSVALAFVATVARWGVIYLLV